MAFNIEQFKTTHDRGFLRPSNYLVYIYPPTWALRDGGAQKWNGPDLAYLAASATLPGLQVFTTESKVYGQGPTVKMPYDIVPTDLTLKFYVDASAKSLTYFYDWLRNIVNLSHVQSESRSGALSNQISYRSEYTTRIDIMLYQDRMRTKTSDPQDGSMMIFTMYDAFPLSIAEPALDWQSGNEIMTFNVTFAYRSFEYKPLPQPVVPLGSKLSGFRGGDPAIARTVPVDLSTKPPQHVPDSPMDTALNKLNSFASNVRENSTKIRTQSVSQLKNVENTIYNNEYIKTAQNIVGAVNDVKKTLGVLDKLNNSFKNNLKQQLKTTTGGKSLKNLF
jgi:hypothetical protein